MDFWKSLSKDPWILSSVGEGVKIHFVSPPFQTVAGRNMKMGDNQTDICDKEVKSLLEKGAIEPVNDSSVGFITQIAQRLPKHYEITKNPTKRYQEILQLPNHYQVATIFGVICDQQITTR